MTIWNMEITAAESPQTVHIPLEGKYYAIKNSGEHDILVSSSVANPTEGADDVMKIPSGSAAIIPVKDGDLYVSAEEDSAYSISIQDDKVIPWSGGTGSGGDGGGDNTHYKGTTTTPLENGSTTNPIVIDGESYTAVFGDVVVYGYTEFIFDGTKWSEFGRPFDTTPIRGSTNAVTSDGIYKRTPFVRGSSGTSACGGNECYAAGGNSIAYGLKANASKPQSFAFGEHLSTTNSDMTAIGRYNSSRAGDLFNIGNGSSSIYSNIVEVNSTEMNVNGDIKINNVAIPTPYTTMPTITADMLGKIAMYVGTSDSNYKQGWNYVAVSDGEETPTYSWKALMDTVPTQGSTNAVTSNGIYKRTPFTRAGSNGTGAALGNSTSTGEHSVAIGSASQATQRDAFAAGYYAYAWGSYSSAFGFNSRAKGDCSHVVGKNNNYKPGDLFEVGNGSNTEDISNILEVNATSMNVNGDIKINNVAIPTPYTTMPTITKSMLGQIAMYVGATGGGFAQGCFYIASTDGAAEPTYSWVKIGSGRTETVLWDNDGTTNPETITLSEAWSNFDELVIVTAAAGSVTTQNESTKHTSIMAIGSAYTMWYNSETTWGSYSATSSTVFTKISSGGDYHIQKIIGIKY